MAREPRHVTLGYMIRKLTSHSPGL